MYHPHAVARIARDLPGVKLIVLVRDPVERAYSQHAHELARGFETETDFARALALEPARLRGQEERLAADPHVLQLLPPAPRLPGPRRVRQLPRARWPRRSAATGSCVVESERFFAEPEPVYDEVLDFLGLPAPAATRRSSGTTPGRAARRWTSGSARELTAHFAPHDERLGDWLGRHAGLARMTRHHAAPRGRRSRRVARCGSARSPGAGSPASSAPASPGWPGSPSPGWSRAGSVPSGPARSSPPPPRSCSPARWRSWAPRPALVYWPARLRARGQTDLLGACLRAALRPVGCAALAVGVALCLVAPALARLTADGPGAAALAGNLRVLAVFLPLPVLTDALLAATRGYRLMPPDRAARPDRPAARCRSPASARGGAVAAASPPTRSRWPGRCRTCRSWLLAGYALRRAHSSTVADLAAPAAQARAPDRAAPRRSGVHRAARGGQRRADSRCSGWTCCWSPRSPASAPPPSTRSRAGSSCSASSPTRASRRPCSRGWPRRLAVGDRAAANRALPDRHRLAGAAHLAALPAGDGVRPAVPRAVRTVLSRRRRRRRGAGGRDAASPPAAGWSTWCWRWPGGPRGTSRNVAARARRHGRRWTSR